MPRLFTGLEIPEDVAIRLSTLRGGVTGAKWIEPADYHLTLSFVGDVGEATASELAEELSWIESPEISIRLKELGSFGGEKPRSIVALAFPSAQLLALQSGHDRALRRVGLKPERRRFTPHITIARVRGAKAPAIAAFLSERFIQPIEFSASRFVLYSAKSSKGGGPYLVEAAYPLG